MGKLLKNESDISNFQEVYLRMLYFCTLALEELLEQNEMEAFLSNAPNVAKMFVDFKSLPMTF